MPLAYHSIISILDTSMLSKEAALTDRLDWARHGLCSGAMSAGCVYQLIGRIQLS
jgi:hypothetical protein